ncbi:MAG TPA: poly-gamma-glutamate hydrolase family protein [Bryobacteraceae bacterium]|nr:poly-gamma-glutamate hydrolase family protein [Bryobacteraceae bacterium]
MAEPGSYGEILQRGHVLGRDFRVAFGDSKIEHCLLVAPHGGGIEPGTSEILRAVVEVGGWAWYEFAGFLRKGNKEALHISSSRFDEPTLKSMLPQAGFVVTFHGASESLEPIVFVGGKWKLGRQTIAESINAAFKEHEIRATDAVDRVDAARLRGLDDSNITNLGRRAEGVQLEFSRGARNLLFPPDSSREARGRRSAELRPLAASINAAIKQLCGTPLPR